MNRRELIMGVGAAALSSGLIGGRSKTAMAATEGAWATSFDGNSYFQNGGGIAGMPSSGYVGTLVFKYRGQAQFSFGEFINAGSCRFVSRTVLIGVSNNVIDVNLWGPLNTTTCNGQNLVAGLANAPVDSNWHDGVISWDGATGTIKISVDAEAKSVSITNYNGYDVATDFTKFSQIGGIGSTGDLTDVGLFAGGAFIEPMDIAENLYSVETGFSLRNGSDGSGIVFGRRPQIWLSGPAPAFATNRAAGSWTWPGTYNDTNPTSNFSVVGNITTAMSDPFEPDSPF